MKSSTIKIKFSLCVILCLFSIFTSCDDEPVNLPTITQEEAINVNSELYNNVERVSNDNLVCIEFIYPFTLNIFDENLDYINSEVIISNLQFSSILNSIDPTHSIGLSFPILGIDSNGNQIEINDKEQLKAYIDFCLKDEIIGNCNIIISEDECIWRVASNVPNSLGYENYFFEMDDLGTCQYFHNGNIYDGSWIFFFIEDELHLNINLDDNNNLISQDWNIDFKAFFVDDNNLKIESSNHLYNLEKKYNSDNECQSIILEGCLNANNEAEYQLSTYHQCIYNYIGLESNQNINLSFYESISDAQNQTNPLADLYVNSQNLKFLIVRVENILTSEIIYLEIVLRNINCN